MILRELLSKFGFEFDDRGARRADRAMRGLQNQVTSLTSLAASAFGATALAAPFIGVLKLASDTQETMELLELAFRENTGTMVKWAEEAGKAAGFTGRSMRKFAADMGILLRPSMHNDPARLLKMSQDLSKVVLDISAAMNISPERAQTVVQSGMTGETEAIKKFGVSLFETRMKADALAKGWRGDIRQLTETQKMTLRYEAIMKDLVAVHGAAANQQYNLAGSSRALKDNLQELGSEIGFILLPAAESLLRLGRELTMFLISVTKDFRAWLAETEAASAALLGLGLILGSVILPILASLAPFVGAFLLMLLALDELLVALQGGKSTFKEFGDWLDEMEKKGTGSTFIDTLVSGFNRFRDVLGAVMALLNSFGSSLVSGKWTEFSNTLEAILDSFLHWIDSLGSKKDEWFTLMDFFIAPIKTFIATLKTLHQIFTTGDIQQALTEYARTLGDMAQKNIDKIIPRSLFETHYLSDMFNGAINPRQRMTAPTSEYSSSVAVRDRLGDVTARGGNHTFHIYQQPGEDTQDFALRVAEILDQRDEEVYTDLVQAGATP